MLQRKLGYLSSSYKKQTLLIDHHSFDTRARSRLECLRQKIERTRLDDRNAQPEAFPGGLSLFDIQLRDLRIRVNEQRDPRRFRELSV